MGCDCCKEISPADYSKCRQDMKRIMKDKKLTYSKKYIAPCGELFKLGEE